MGQSEAGYLDTLARRFPVFDSQLAHAGFYLGLGAIPPSEVPRHHKANSAVYKALCELIGYKLVALLFSKSLLQKLLVFSFQYAILFVSKGRKHGLDIKQNTSNTER